MSVIRRREVASRLRALMGHAARLEECKKRRPDFNVTIEVHALTARWMEHDGPAKQTIARVKLAEELLIRVCLSIIMFEDDRCGRADERSAKKR